MMIYRLMTLMGAALLLVDEPALANFSLRIDNPRGHAPATAGTNDDASYHYYTPPAGGEYGYDAYGYPYFIGPYGPYPIVPSPRLGPAPTVVPPLIARPVPPQPMLLLRLRDGTRIAVPYPRIRRYVPPYPDFLTSGSAYYPTPTYPFAPPQARRHRQFDRHPRHHRGR
jgi:hypothetical protein